MTSSHLPSSVAPGAVGEPFEGNPFRNLVGCGVDDGELRLGLVGGKHPAVVNGKRNALGLPRDVNDRERLARLKIQHADRAHMNVGRVAALAVVGDGQHVRFRLAGGHRTQNAQAARIDDGDGFAKLGGDVKQAILGSKNRAMGAQRLSQVDAYRSVCAWPDQSRRSCWPSVPGEPTPELP